MYIPIVGTIHFHSPFYYLLKPILYTGAWIYYYYRQNSVIQVSISVTKYGVTFSKNDKFG